MLPSFEQPMTPTIGGNMQARGGSFTSVPFGLNRIHLLGPGLVATPGPFCIYSLTTIVEGSVWIALLFQCVRASERSVIPISRVGRMQQ